MIKVFIDPGHGGQDPGAVANGLQEKDLTLQIALKMRDILLEDFENISVRMSRTRDQTVSLEGRTNAANEWGADYFVSVHINAGGGSGFESFVYPVVPRQTITYQAIVHQNIMKRVSLSDRGMKQADYHVLRESRMDAILTENGFIDHPHDAVCLKEASFIEQLARGHAEGIAAAFQLAKKQKEAATQEYEVKADGLFLVQLGAFKEKGNAEQLVREAEEKGFQAFVKAEEDYYKVQIGAFQERRYADDLLQKAVAAGFQATLLV